MSEAQSFNPVSPIQITESAQNFLKEIIAEQDGEPLLRIFVTGGGCSGFQYGFAFDEEPQDDDAIIESNAIRLLVDPMSYQYLVGAQIDYKDELMGAQFVIENPNATTTCGCGSSFSV